MNFSKKTILITISALLAVCASIYLLLGYVASYFFTPGKIQQIVNEQTGLVLVLENSKIRTLPDLSLQISADKFILSLPNSTDSVINADNLRLRVRILPVLFKNISISSFSADKIIANIKRDKNGKFNFEKFIKQEGNLPLHFKLKQANLDFKKVLFDFYDEKNFCIVNFVSDKLFFDLKANPDKLYLDTNSDLKICALDNKNCSKTNISVFINTKLPANKYLNSKDTDYNIDIQGFNLSYFKPYINEFSDVKFNNLSNKSDVAFKKVSKSPYNQYLLNFDSENTFAEFLYNGKNSSVKLIEPAKLVLNLIAKNDELEIENSSFIADKIDVGISGKVNSYRTNKPKPDINLNIKNSDFMKFINLVPAGLVVYKTDVINELLKANPHAVANGAVNVSGKYSQPDINGKVNISDVYLFSPPTNFKSANVDCDFVGDKVNVDVLVYGPNNQYVSVKGYSEIYDKQAGDYEVISSDAVDLSFAHKHLIPVQRVIGFKLGPLPYMKLSGTGKIHIKTKGTIYDAVVYGKFFGKNITASMEGLNTILKNGKIELDFNGKVINIIDTTADIEDGKFLLSGFADDYNNLDITAQIKNIGADKLLNIAKSSPLVKPFSGDLSFIKSAKGKTDATINFKGKAKSLEGMDFIKDISPAGDILLNSVSAVVFPNISLNNVRGKISFSDVFDVNLNADFNGAKFTTVGSLEPVTKNLSDKNARFKVDLNTKISSMLFSKLLNIVTEQNYFNNQSLKFALLNTPIKSIDFIFNADGRVRGIVTSDLSKTDFSMLSVNGNFNPINSQNSKHISFANGKYSINGSKVLISNSRIKLFGSDIYTDGQINSIFKNPQANLKLRANSVALDNIQNIAQLTNIEAFRVLLADFVDYKGSLNLNIDIKRNLPYGKLTFNNVSMFNKKQQIPLELKSGDVKFAGDKIFLDAFNINYGKTPFYFDATMKDYLGKKPVFNAMYSTNIDEISADRIINPYLTYPFKVKGEIRSKGRIKGDFNNYSVISYLTLPIGTDITYMGANVGDVQYNREFEAKADFTKNIAKVNSVKYVKFIPSQNNKPTPVTMLKASGRVVSTGKNLNFDNFKIVTPNPVTAKIFNVIFKKSVLKQGLFTCDLNLNGNVLLPHATGKINFRNINIPLYSTKINDMDCDVSKNIINATIRGKSFDSDVEIIANVKNKQTLPIVVNNLDVKSKKTSLSQLIEGISQLPKGSSDIVPGQPIVLKPSDLIILNGHASVDVLELYDIKATNLVSDFSAQNGDMLNIENMDFNIAGGKVNTKGNFDIATYLFDVDSIVSDCDANLLSKNFLGLENQIFGKVNAKINLKGKIPENAQDIKLVSGKVNFTVNNGKMPKLGSLEYLLRAGNLFKSGILGLTLNNLIEVLTPYKTGEFSAIRGSFDVHDGKISSLEIFSKGNNLSLFIYGGYDIINDNANIEILGRLSKNVSNVLGAAGNASLNTLFSTLTGNKIKEGAKSQIIENVNKIPLIEITGDDYRLFLAKIKGRLNSDDYVKSFNWLN